ncbi:MAG: hypothetical protein HUU23_05770 [Caldilineales bacterium]|nr:hypothetical protein [Caldilineales bacterium]
MNDPFDPDALLAAILALVRAHDLPASSLSVDISLLQPAFAARFPQFQTQPGRLFAHAGQVDGVAVHLHIKPRLPFAELAAWLDGEIFPAVQALAGDAAGLATRVRLDHAEDDPRRDTRFQHSIHLECRGQAEEEMEILAVAAGARQVSATSYPILFAYVGWLVDEESDGSFGVDAVYDFNPLHLEAHPDSLGRLQQALPLLRRHFHAQLQRLRRQQA